MCRSCPRKSAGTDPWPVQEYPEIVGFYFVAAANSTLVEIVQIDGTQERVVLFRQFVHHPLHLTLGVEVHQRAIQVHGRIFRFFHVVVHSRVPRLRTGEFPPHVFRHGIHECPEALRVFHATFVANYFQDPQEGLLLDVLHQLRGPQPRAQVKKQQVAKIRRQVIPNAAWIKNRPLSE